MPRRVRVHVASRNTAPATELCIRSLRRHAGHPFELTVGDSGSNDGSLELLRGLEERGWLRLEAVAEPRPHAEWLDRWLGACDAELAVFVDSDVELLRDGWLRRLVETATKRDAALVCAELLRESPNFVEPVGGKTVRLAERPAPWLLLIDVERVRALGVSFAFAADHAAPVPEGIVAYDVGAVLFCELRARGLPWTRMPWTYRRFYRHYGGLSWRPRDRQRAQVERRLRVLRESTS